MSGYRLSSRADKDYQDILTYTIEKWGVIQFQKYGDLLRASFKRIAENPELPLSRSREDLFTGCRILKVESHYVLYRQHDGFVEIARILSVRSHLRRHIPQEYK